MALELRAYAKVNLTLEVLGRRSDGYHQVLTVLQAVDLADRLILEEAVGLTQECSDPGLASQENLALRAARLLRERTGCRRGALIRLEKAIPVAAGLGGGSSDAAATLRGLNRVWDLALSLDELLPLAAELGTDVPFFLRGGTALAQGRGEEISSLPPLPETWLVLLRPPLDVGMPGKTARLYTLLSPANYSDGGATRRLVEHLKGGSLSPNLLMNAFEAVVDLAFPSLQDYRTLLHQAGATEVHLTGTGPALYALVARREDGERMVQQLRSWGQEAYLVCTVPPHEG